jgi:hypothetical protein
MDHDGEVLALILSPQPPPSFVCCVLTSSKRNYVVLRWPSLSDRIWSGLIMAGAVVQLQIGDATRAQARTRLQQTGQFRMQPLTPPGGEYMQGHKAVHSSGLSPQTEGSPHVLDLG